MLSVSNPAPLLCTDVTDSEGKRNVSLEPLTEQDASRHNKVELLLKDFSDADHVVEGWLTIYVEPREEFQEPNARNRRYAQIAEEINGFYFADDQPNVYVTQLKAFEGLFLLKE